ncbi:protein shisa-like-2A isoform X1 [Sceloporus undulatus]|uniref:protein shisa-like-2A isoform X1 n=1 Tax=Sceloporus undulatus TaxID=8520 RepID=UPI001C4C31CB|nr:protein shisa-like-2A isoform X1 [Sceloporus undulatus]
MSADCASYMDAQQVLVSAFRCPRREEGDEASAVYCCGFQDVKYCCDDPNSFFPYQHSYMWWLRSLKPSHNLSLQEQVGIVHQSGPQGHKHSQNGLLLYLPASKTDGSTLNLAKVKAFLYFGFVRFFRYAARTKPLPWSLKVECKEAALL